MSKSENNWKGKDAVKFVKAKAKELGMEIPDFIARMGINRTTYWRWKNGRTTAYHNTMYIILTKANSLLAHKR